jgi:hypothetical protein
MAGDWIKVECSTSRKAEVLRMAEMLGVSRRECMGLLMDYWSWLDANARTEFVPNLSRKSLDDVLQCQGLASCLESVGWAKWSADGWTMQVVNYDHHNGTSAKTRASDARKKRISRGQNRDKNGTREEEEKNKRKDKKKIPDDFQISERVKAWALAKGYAASCRAKGYGYVDWDEALMNAIRKDWAGMGGPAVEGKKRVAL